MQAIFEKAKRVRLMMFDVDGVLTDGRLYISDAGEEFKAFNTLDGHGLRMLKATGVEIAIITGRTARCVEIRATNLGIGLLYQGVEDKLAVSEELLARFSLHADEAAFMGDDLPDLPVMRRCGLALTVPEAPALIKQHAHHVTRCAGGRGAVREVCEILMHAQGTYDQGIALYLQ
ncbi:MAG: 3-deoxy-manno-octulosonate-8-phosphatase KdsC [Burkholderiales bacterium]|nr:3-deoxy-manno-octulosonate-8-phosphatase KdsC [Burkholderiales bacterium]